MTERLEVSSGCSNFRRSPDTEMLRISADGSHCYKEKRMSGDCEKCHEHCLDCRCRQTVSKSNKVNHPAHYQGNKFEVIDIIEDFGLDFDLGNAIKYILRSGKKGDTTQDIQKAIWYLERALDKHGT